MSKPNKFPCESFESLGSVIGSLVIPGTNKPITRSSFDITYRPSLQIKYFNQFGGPRSFASERAYVRDEDAERIRQAFIAKHWRKFQSK
jgi:hypothetical protein